MPRYAVGKMPGRKGRPGAFAPRLLACLLLLPLPGNSSDDCLVVAHRGASGYLPEHTLAAYRLAIELGADYVEPDVVMTRDGIPIARHESWLNATTDVASRPEFASRRRVQLIGGSELDGWFSEDFTLEEIRTLRATERWPDLRPDSAAENGRHLVPTLQEVIDLLVEVETADGKRIGIYPELKQPEYFEERDLDVVGTVIATLHRNGYRSQDDPALIQSFESAALREAAKVTDLRLMQLLWSDEPSEIDSMLRPHALREVAAYADGIGVPKYGFVIEPLADGPAGAPVGTGLVSDAHDAGLLVHVFTFRAENRFLPAQFRAAGGDAAKGDLAGELELFVSAGIDGFFIDQPEVGRLVCDAPPRP